ncbi:ribosome recycling factor [Candidatus Mycoplasma mahonii]|uniref:ribosome recycling factor n=1 Tax=Candidatus Mycoplasma mahonii TaxID=3004105 RepID=UPI0026F1A62A|nr:ribosome recycling factor [Candidatus Mycoplasma mahonii]WKX02531.1 ribosome recycling factor [Candidatus Mycoplasma mahonii]
MEYKLYELEAIEIMEKAVESYKSNLKKITVGRANPSLLDSIVIDYFDSPTPLSQIAAISIPDSRQLLVKPYDMSINNDIVAMINKSSLGIVAVDEGDKTRITFPEINTDRRRELVKMLVKYTEGSKVLIRGARQHVNKEIKVDEELSKDQSRDYLEEIQQLTNKYTNKIDVITKSKEKDLMTI